MKKLLYGVLLVALAGLVIAPALAEDDTKLDVHAEVWNRTEYLENFTDFNDSDAFNDNVDYTTYRARLNMALAVTDDVSASIEVQNVGVWGNGFPSWTNSQDPTLGTLQLTDTGGSNDTTLYQAVIVQKNMFGSPLSLSVGRQEHVLGNELHMGDGDFYAGQYFDGIRGTLDFENWDMDFFYYKIQERSILPGSLFGGAALNGGNGGSDDRDLVGFTAKFNVGEGHELEPYLLLARDGIGVTLPAPLSVTLVDEYSTATLGILYEHPRSDDGMFDWSLEVAAQDGEIKNRTMSGACPVNTDADCDQSSMIAEAEFGATFAEKHRVSIGGLMIGDGDDAQDREDFISIAPDTHRRAGAMDMFSELSVGAVSGAPISDTFQNLTNIYLAYGWTGEKQAFEVAFHDFALTEDFNGPEDEIGQEVDLIYTLTQSDYTSLQIGVAQFMPGDLFMAPNDEDALRAWAMLRFRN